MEQNNDSIDPFFEEPILWQFSPSRYCKFTSEHIYSSIVPACLLVVGFILALTGVIMWTGLLLFGGVAAISCIITYLQLPRRARPMYAITETKIFINPFLMADFTDIKKIKKSHSLFKRNVGTIKFKLKKGISVNYQFAKIDDVDKVYDLLISLWEKRR